MQVSVMHTENEKLKFQLKYLVEKNIFFKIYKPKCLLWDVGIVFWTKSTDTTDFRCSDMNVSLCFYECFVEVLDLSLILYSALEEQK